MNGRRYGLLVAAACLALSGCLGAATTIEIDDTGAGTVTFEYSVSKLASYLGREDADARYLAVPLAEDEVAGLVSRVDGAELSSYSEQEDSENLLYDVAIDFSSVADLEALFAGLDGPQLTVSETDSSTRLDITVYSGLEAEPEDSVVEMIQSMFGDYELVWTITAPAPIIEATDGTFEGRTATVSFVTSEVLVRTDPLVWSVAW